MVQRLFVAVLGCSLLVACGDGGAKVPTPPPGGVERPLPNPQDPLPDDQQPERNDQAPVSSPLPGGNLTPENGNSGGSGNGGGGGDPGPGNGGRGNPGPGNRCTQDDACARCDNCRDLCECRELGDEVCDLACD